MHAIAALSFFCNATMMIRQPGAANKSVLHAFCPSPVKFFVQPGAAKSCRRHHHELTFMSPTPHR
jgi:hypothetical protein